MVTALKIAALCMLLVLAAGAVWAWTPDRKLSALEEKYLRAPGDLVQIAGTTLHVRDDGPRDAPVLIMIHGFGSSLHTWEPWAQALKDQYRVIRFDLPGSGLSQPDPTNDYTDARTIAVIVALMDQRAVRRATLVGNSIGGRIAWTFAAIHPDRVAKLVLISPDGYASEGFAYGRKPSVPVMMKLMRYALPKSMLRMSLEPAYGTKSNLTDATVDRYWDLMLAPGSRSALLARMEQTVLQDPKPLLQRITAPTLLVWGGKDAMIPPANAADYQRELVGSRLITLPNLGHLPFEEAPAESLSGVRAFLGQ